MPGPDVAADGFERWRRQGWQHSEIVEPAYPFRGACSWFPHGHALAEAVLRKAGERLTGAGYREVILATLVSRAAFERQAEHIKSFLDHVYLATPPGEPRPQVIKPTIEAQISSVFAAWRQAGRPLPMRVFTARSVGRRDSGRAAPLWKERIVWPFFEAHAALDGSVDDELERLDDATHALAADLCVPTMGVERLNTHRRLAEYAHRRLEAITIMPSGQITVLTSVYDLGERFSRVFGVRGARPGTWAQMVNYAFSGRLIMAMVGHGFHERSPLHAPAVAPIQVALVPCRNNRPEAIEAVTRICRMLTDAGVRAQTIADNGTLGARLERARALGTPLQILVGDEELRAGTVSIRSLLPLDAPSVPVSAIASAAAELLERCQRALLSRSRERQRARLRELESLDELPRITDEGFTSVLGLCGEMTCTRALAGKPGGEVLGRVLRPARLPRECIVCRARATMVALWGRKYVGEK